MEQYSLQDIVIMGGLALAFVTLAFGSLRASMSAASWNGRAGSSGRNGAAKFRSTRR